MKIRLVGSGDDLMNKGDLQLTTIIDTNLKGVKAAWYHCHHCDEDILIKDHQIQQLPDGTISITPSLVCPTEGCKGHFYITNSEVLDV